MLARLLGSLLVALSMGCEGPPTDRCGPDIGTDCDDASREPACVFGALHETRVDDATLSELAGVPNATREEALRALFPFLGDKPLVDGELAAPASVTWSYASFAPYTATLPIDWEADPEGNFSWRWWFQTLGWLFALYQGTPEDVDAAIGVVSDWADNVLYRDPPLEWTWGDHGLAIRYDRAMRALQAYAAAHDRLDRHAVDAAAQLVLHHIYAMATPICYSPGHNHGLIQDLNLLVHLPSTPNLRDFDALYGTASTRFAEQVAVSVADDGVHVENSPHYHVVFIELLTQAIDAFGDAGRDTPPWLVETRDALLSSIVHMLQPDNSIPQFGDSPNDTKRPELIAVIERAREQPDTDLEVLERVEWMLSGGQTGEAPARLDRVFETSGYVAFHSDSRDVTGHMTCGRLSGIHYQQDESSIELFGFDRTLVTDTGLHGYDDVDPFTLHQREPAAHNVLTVDDAGFDPHGDPHLVGYSLDGPTSWAQCRHGNYAPMGVALRRTFAHLKPHVFVVVDHVRANASHAYAQHFHLHPSLTEVERLDDRTWLAHTSDGSGPAVMFRLPSPPDRMEQERGQEGPRLRGWHYPAPFTREPATVVSFHHRSDAEDVDFPVLIELLAPGAATANLSDLRYDEVGDEGVIEVTGAVAQTLRVPRR